MKLIGLMLARNEDWVLGLSLRAALKWTDGMVVLNHASTDRTKEIIDEVIKESKKPITYLEEPDTGKWDEMVVRQRTLDAGRQMGGTHFAIIDADEILTSNLWMIVRQFIQYMADNQLLELPMLACWKSLDEYRDDDSDWSKAFISLAFKDSPKLCWMATKDGYQHHNRPPGGTTWVRFTPFKDKKEGGVMHLQFSNWRRLRAKHYWYRMVEAIRWPGRESNERLNRKYNQALDETGIKLSSCPTAWMAPIKQDLHRVDLECGSWHEDEIRRLWKGNKREVFFGLELPEDILGEKVVWPKPLPPTPKGLVATACINGVTLGWEAVPGVRAYRIRRSMTPGGPYRGAASVEGSKTSYTDINLTAGSACYYMTRSVNADGESEDSEEVSAIPIPAMVPRVVGPTQFVNMAIKTDRDLVPRLWVCESCALVGVAPYVAARDKSNDMCSKLIGHHKKESPSCSGTGLRLVIIDNVIDDRIIGRFNGH
jgi:hypothetical protein